MSIPKTRYIYEAVTKGINIFGDRHHINARAHLAPSLVFMGDNAHIQLSNTLNSTPSNPVQPKRLSVDHLDIILRETDDFTKEYILRKLVEEHGFGLCKEDTDKGSDSMDLLHVMQMFIGLDRHHGTLADHFGEAIKDGEIDKNESEAIREVIGEFRRMLRGFEEKMKEVE